VPRIKAAAIRLQDGRVFTGRMHGDIIQGFPGKVKREDTVRVTNGFVTDEDRFVSRREALDIAKAAGQVPVSLKELFSEDLMRHDPNYWKEERDDLTPTEDRRIPRR